jgi:hypothetical protein
MSDEEPENGYECLICGESVRRQPAQQCSSCTCKPWHIACAPELKTCPQCAKPSLQPFRAPVTLGAPLECVDLTGQHGTVLSGRGKHRGPIVIDSEEVQGIEVRLKGKEGKQRGPILIDQHEEEEGIEDRGSSSSWSIAKIAQTAVKIAQKILTRSPSCQDRPKDKPGRNEKGKRHRPEGMTGETASTSSGADGAFILLSSDEDEDGQQQRPDKRPAMRSVSCNPPSKGGGFNMGGGWI